MHTLTTPAKRTLFRSRTNSQATTPRRIAGILAVALLAASSLGALDYGANLENQSNIRGGDDGLSPSFTSSLTGWVRHNPHFDGSTTWRAFLESSVTSIDSYPGGEWENDLVFDVDLMRLDGIFPGALGPQSVFRLRAGRFTLSEPTGLIFADRADGVSLSLDLPRMTLATGGGYTGLIRRANSAVGMTLDDVLDRAEDPAAGAARRAVGTVHAQFPELLGRQTLTTGVVAQFDLRNEDNDPEEILDSQYAFAGFDGPVGSGLYYEASLAASRNDLTLNGQEQEDTYGIGGRFGAEWYLDAREASVLSIESRYASGEQQGALGPFVPVSDPAFDLLSLPSRNDDSTLFLLDYALRPFAGREGAIARSLQASVYGAASFSSDLTETGSYRGVEAGTRVNLRPLSDLGARIVFGGFFPDDTPNEPELLGRVEISTSY